jgi:hypothetical protein
MKTDQRSRDALPKHHTASHPLPMLVVWKLKTRYMFQWMSASLHVAAFGTCWASCKSAKFADQLRLLKDMIVQYMYKSNCRWKTLLLVSLRKILVIKWTSSQIVLNSIICL